MKAAVGQSVGVSVGWWRAVAGSCYRSQGSLQESRAPKLRICTGGKIGIMPGPAQPGRAPRGAPPAHSLLAHVGAGVRRQVDAAHVRAVNVCVQLGSRDVGVAEKLLDNAQVGTTLE